MANIASGWVTLRPVSESLYHELRDRILAVPSFFCYGDLIGKPDINYDGIKLSIGFTARWECSDAWDMIDSLLSDKTYLFSSELINAEIHGRGWETGGNYNEAVRKLVGEEILKRRRK